MSVKKAAILDKGQSTLDSGVSSFGYLPFLDGLRAISILLVMGFHHLGPVSGFIGSQLNGWVGVDLFFIISGYLITSILVKEEEKKGSFSLKNFYVRRWLRICPAYYAFLALIFVSMLLSGGHDFSAFAIAGLYLTNIDMCFSWGLCPAATGLLHTWSLCVEEQFYLFWPAALKLSGRKALVVCLGLLALAYVWRLYLVAQGASWMRLSSGLDTKLDSIMLGVAVALLWRIKSCQAFATKQFKFPFAQISIAALLLTACHFLGHPGTETNAMLFWALKLPVVLLLMTALLVSLLVNQTSSTARVLSCKPLVFIGKLSYSLYLWHVIVNFPSTHAIFESVCMHKRYLVELAKFASCISLAATSFYLIEQPFLKLKSKFS